MDMYVVFDGRIVKEDGKYRISGFSLVNADRYEISDDEIRRCIEDNFQDKHIFEVRCNGFACTVISRKTKEDEFYISGFAYNLERPVIDDGIFDLFDDTKNISVVLYGEDGRIIFANKAFLEATGFSYEEVRGKYICDFILDSHKSICEHHVKERVKGEKFSSRYFGVKIATKDGKYRIFSVYGNSVIFKGKPAGFLVGLDETEEDNLKRVYSALKNVNQLIIRVNDEDELLDNICRVLVEVGFKAAVIAEIKEDLSVQIVYTAGECKDFFGRVKASVDGESKYGIGMAARAFRDGKIVINPDTETNPYIEFWRKDLLECGFLSHCAIPIRIKDKVRYVLLVFSDHKNAFISEFLDLLRELTIDIEFALEKLEKDKYIRLIGEVLNRIEESVVITDENCEIEFVNNAFLKIFGYKSKEVIGKSILQFVEEGECEQKKNWVMENVLKNGVARFESRMKLESGKVKTFDISIASVMDKKGETKLIGLMRDITKGKKQQEKIEQLSRLYKTLFYLNEALISAESEVDIFKDVCGLIVDHLGADVSFLIFNIDGKWNLSHAAISNDELEPFVMYLKNSIAQLPQDVNYLPFIRAFETGSVKLIDDMENDKRSQPFVDQIKAYGFKKCFAVPIGLKGKRVAVLVSVFRENIAFDKEFVALLNQIKDDIAASIGVIVDRRWNRIISLAMQKGFSYVVVMDKDFRIVYMNEAAIEMHGFSKDEVLGKKQTVFSSGLHDFSFIRRFVKAMKKGEIFSDVFSYRTKDGRIVYGYTTIIPYKEDGVEYYIAVGKDITKETTLQKRLAYLSSHDLLTGLPNKESFIKQAQDLLRSATDKEIMAVAIVDIKNCSYINQAYGYKGGDEVIKETAQRIRNFLKEDDVLGRLAGDKFSLVMSGYLSEEDVLISLSRLLKLLNKPIKLDGSEFLPSYCIGVSFYPSDGTNIEDLLTKAEFALANAKREGDYEIGFFKKRSQQEALKIIELKSKLADAFKNREFVLFYQPYYDVKSGKIAGAESLIRWIHDGEVIPPSDFIETLENSNLIYDVEEYLINEAVRTVSQCKRKVPISINISAKSFKRDYLVTTISQALKDFGVDGDYLTVEIVERVFLESKSYTKNIMDQLKAMNVRIAVDDFGTGYSSLTYIRELPIDILKIDISFIRGMMKDKKDLSLVRLIINVAKEFGFKTVAEGVETNEQLELLKSLGCDYVQGFLFSRPLEKEKFLSLLG